MLKGRMTQLITPRASHWYRRTPNGIEPFYEIERADGKGLRAVTLRDARKVGAMPSVTNVISVLAKPALTTWLQTQAIMAALTLPRRPDEPLDDYARRVVADMDQQSQMARDFGTEIHAAIECELTRIAYAPVAGIEHLASDIEPFLPPIRDWLAKNVGEIHGTELYVGAYGTAGRLDLDCDLAGIGRAIVDIKTQGVKRDAKGQLVPAFYPEWPLQLCAYAHCRAENLGRLNPTAWSLVSVVIDSKEPGGIYAQTWPAGEDYWTLFQAALDLWCYVRGYDPRV